MAGSSSYSTGVPVEISPTLTIKFPVDKLVDEFVANMYDIPVDFNKESKTTIQKRLYEENHIPTVDEPGISTLIDAFIRLIIKAIGTFAQQVFTITDLVKRLKLALKNPTDKSNASYISSIPNKIKELMKEATQIFSDTANWIIKKFLGALGKINIPIPAFSFDILGFELKVPKIDNKGLIKAKFTIPAKENSEISSLQIQIKTEKLKGSKDKTKLNELNQKLDAKIQSNPIAAFTDSIKKLIIGIIKFPIDFLFGLFKQLIDTLTGILSFDFSGFDKLIKMMKPSVDSVKKLIVGVLDTIITGFSKLYDNVTKKFGKGKKDKKKKEDINEHLRKNGLGIMGWSDTEENTKKLNKLIAFFNLASNVTDAFSQLFLSLVIELFNYALDPVGIKVG
jgi:hypothetical protein